MFIKTNIRDFGELILQQSVQLIILIRSYSNLQSTRNTKAENNNTLKCERPNGINEENYKTEKNAPWSQRITFFRNQIPSGYIILLNLPDLKHVSHLRQRVFPEWGLLGHLHWSSWMIWSTAGRGLLQQDRKWCRFIVSHSFTSKENLVLCIFFLIFNCNINNMIEF